MKKALSIFSVMLLFTSIMVMAEIYPTSYFERAKTFVNYLSQGNFQQAEKMFTQRVMEALPSSKLETIWKSLEAQLGQFEEVKNMNAGKSGDYVVVMVNVEFKKGYMDFKLVFDSSFKIAGFWITRAKSPKHSLPAYVQLSKFTTREVEIGQRWKLPAELTVPKGSGPFPAVVLIGGSGPSDMNETIGENEPFKDIAYGLSSLGIAVLRYDKRAYVYRKEMKKIDVQNVYLQDASYAIEYMLHEPFVDKIFVLGHSLGAYLLPEIAKENPEVSGLIMMAPPARPLAEVMVDQLRYISKLSPQSAEEIQKILDKLTLIEKHELNPQEFVMGAPASYYYELEKYDPVKILRTLSKPVLICQGGKDYQVTRKDFEIFEKAFESDPLFTFKWYPNLSHIFTVVNGIPSPTNYNVPSNVSKEVIEDLVEWIKRYSP